MIVATFQANMRRHISKKHSQEVLSSVSTGNCICFECDFRCHRIVELRKHLVTSHNFVAECETLNFNNFEGGICLYTSNWDMTETNQITINKPQIINSASKRTLHLQQRQSTRKQQTMIK